MLGYNKLQRRSIKSTCAIHSAVNEPYAKLPWHWERLLHCRNILILLWMLRMLQSHNLHTHHAARAYIYRFCIWTAGKSPLRMPFGHCIYIGVQFVRNFRIRQCGARLTTNSSVQLNLNHCMATAGDNKTEQNTQKYAERRIIILRIRLMFSL